MNGQRPADRQQSLPESGMQALFARSRQRLSLSSSRSERARRRVGARLRDLDPQLATLFERSGQMPQLSSRRLEQVGLHLLPRLPGLFDRPHVLGLTLDERCRRVHRVSSGRADDHMRDRGQAGQRSAGEIEGRRPG